MKRQSQLPWILSLALLIWGLAPLTSSAQDSSLVSLLVQQLGITETQAQGGAGALFNMAKEKLSPQEFGQVADTVPEMDTLLQSAPKKSEGLGGMLGKGSSMFGGDSKQNLEGGTGLASSFSQLGLSPETMNQFVPVILTMLSQREGRPLKTFLPRRCSKLRRKGSEPAKLR